MNYYNPYFASYPYYGIANAANTATKTGLLSRIFGNGMNFSSILSGTQKTLNIANQAIPLIRQVQPMMRNARTMFKVMNEFKKVDTKTDNEVVNSPISTTNESIINETTTPNYSDYGPTFFQ